jgi:hypothetical protein
LRKTNPVLRKLLLLPALIFCTYTAPAQILEGIVLRDGDLIFQDLDCGPLCDAIEQVTQSYGHRHFSHIGLVYFRNDSVYIVEAIGKSVQLTPMSVFKNRTSHEMLIGRAKSSIYPDVAENAVRFALTQLGKPYDEAFLYNNSKYYCSELIYDAFRAANGNKDFFVLQPMTFKQPGSGAFFPVWTGYYKKLGIAIPEGKPGINPGGISLSDKIDILNP